MIDAHQHFWDRSRSEFNYAWLKNPGHEPIDHDFMPDDLRDHLKAVGIDQSVFVQTQHTVAENRWVLALADANDFIAGVVGWVDLASEACEEQLLQFMEHPKAVGIRHITQDEPDDDFILRPEVLRGLGVLQKYQFPFDLLFYVKHLKHADQLGRTFPELPMVIDHLAKPKIKEQSLDDWLPQFKAAAQHPQIYCKLSGMITEADWASWKPDDLKPYVEAALTYFGPSRCMYGSDWPVCELAGQYEQVFEALQICLEGLSSDERDEIFDGTARRFYGLKGR